ncbi:hypothetical protein LSAT2_030982 [Lamellibrachia satsuma]|nr:hypothetical protein LSAT2_030982 [Lamellibrachia satsuma]
MTARPTTRHPEYFHMKIFGNARYRYLALAVPRNESKLVKVLKVVLDQSVMRNIFQACHNVYKPDSEPSITDNCALRMMKFNPRLFEVKLSQRMVNVTYIEDVDFFVVTEGEAARWVNFHSGMNINLALKGLQSLGQFIRLAASAQTEKAIDNALLFKFNHARINVDEYLRSGLRETMYT